MNREDILKELEGYKYTLYGGQEAYAVVQTISDAGEPLDPTNFIEHYADSMQDGQAVAVISLDKPFEDDQDIYETLQYCECYTGQYSATSLYNPSMDADTVSAVMRFAWQFLMFSISASGRNLTNRRESSHLDSARRGATCFQKACLELIHQHH